MSGDLTGSLKRAAAGLEKAEVPYLLGGGLGCWARGGPRSSKDIDLMVRPADAEAVLATLAGLGMRTERPPEQWLFKAWDGDVLIDVIFEPAGLEMTDRVFDRGEMLNVDGMTIPVMHIDDIFTTKLMALDERVADYRGLLELGRTLREQVDWPALRERTSRSPFARAYFVLVEGLGITESGRGPGA